MGKTRCKESTIITAIRSSFIRIVCCTIARVGFYRRLAVRVVDAGTLQALQTVNRTETGAEKASDMLLSADLINTQNFSCSF
jgi:hypothetical protein